jgi:hypothetical protein
MGDFVNNFYVIFYFNYYFNNYLINSQKEIIMTKIITREFYAKRADKLEAEYTEKILKADMKRGWNNTFGRPIPGVNELERELNTKLKILNNRCVSYGFAPLYEDEEQQPVQPMKRVE